MCVLLLQILVVLKLSLLPMLTKVLFIHLLTVAWFLKSQCLTQILAVKLMIMLLLNRIIVIFLERSLQY